MFLIITTIANENITENKKNPTTPPHKYAYNKALEALLSYIETSLLYL